MVARQFLAVLVPCVLVWIAIYLIVARQQRTEGNVQTAVVSKDDAGGDNCKLTVTMKGTTYTAWVEGADYLGDLLLDECAAFKLGDTVPVVSVPIKGGREIFEWKGIVLRPPALPTHDPI